MESTYPVRTVSRRGVLFLGSSLVLLLATAWILVRALTPDAPTRVADLPSASAQVEVGPGADRREPLRPRPPAPQADEPLPASKDITPSARLAAIADYHGLSIEAAAKALSEDTLKSLENHPVDHLPWEEVEPMVGERFHSKWFGHCDESRDWMFEDAVTTGLQSGGGSILEWVHRWRGLGMEIEERDRLVAEARRELLRLGTRQLWDELAAEYRDAYDHKARHGGVQRSPYAIPRHLQQEQQAHLLGRRVHAATTTRLGGWAMLCQVYEGEFPTLDAAVEAWEIARREARAAIYEVVKP